MKAMPMPLDVRLMNITTAILVAVAVLMTLAAVGGWLVRLPVFALRGITVQGDVVHNSAATLRTNVAPRIAGNFFTVDLGAARQAFLEVPWVREAQVRREFPNRMRVILQEHKPVAYWGDEDDNRLVNMQGDLFQANPGDVEVELPRLYGPEAQSRQVLAMYQALAPRFAALEMDIEEFRLTSRGSWQALLDTGATIELGRGTQEEVSARAQRFLATITQAAGRFGRRPEALVAADLRHADGYAIRLRGVSTLSADAQKK